MQTKIHRPMLSVDVIERPDLIERLNQGQNRALTLISTPAGFGKSTLVNQWVEGLDGDWCSAWFSVDQSDNDLRVFLLYVVNAIRLVEPDSCRESLTLIQMDELPEPEILARVFINDVMVLRKPLLMVVDDFHCINNPKIGRFLTVALSYPPPSLHWVILTRRDPAISLNKMRAAGSVNELRLEDLRFSSAEMDAFFDVAIEVDAPPLLKKMAHEKIEGWAAALRLLALSMRGSRSVDDVVKRLPSVPARVSSYLIEEILSEIPPDYRNILLKMSLFGRFNAELCSSVITDADGDDFLKWLIETNLFVVSSGSEDDWIRFPHYFQDTLQLLLKEEYSPSEIHTIHQRAAEWFAHHDLVRQAIHHALLSGDEHLAGKVVEHNVQISTKQGYYFLRGLWFSMLPKSVVNKNPILLIELAWQKFRANLDWKSVMGRAEKLIEHAEYNADESLWAQCNFACMQCSLHYDERDFDASIEIGQRALSILPADQFHLRALTVRTLALSYRGKRNYAAALLVIYEGREACLDDDAALGVIHSADSYRYLLSMDMPGLLASAKHYFQHCEEARMWSIGGLARVLVGCAYYQMNDLAQAEEWLLGSKEGLSRMDYRNVIWCQGYLLRTYAAQEKWDDVDRLLKQLLDDVRDRPNPLFLKIVESLQIEIALRRGHLTSAMMWMEQSEVPACGVSVINLNPAVVYIRVLLVRNSETSRKQAKEMIDVLSTDAELTNITESRVLCMILMALWYAVGKLDEADKKVVKLLGEAVRIAQHGGNVRIFADFGNELTPWLGRLELDVEGVEYVRLIIHAMKKPASSCPDVNPLSSQVSVEMSLMDSLSKRELEILHHLSGHLSNNEISEELFISLGTVKRHVSNIYQKLGVHGRKAAVTKAVGLGLLTH
jgi:LuxR family maltose regulon positive regulatory protein